MPNTTSADDSVLLIQLSDSHLFSDPAKRLLGMNTHESLSRVVQQVAQQHPQIDLVLATGDLSQDGTQSSYQNFRQCTAPLDSAARWLAGNHDELTAMQAACVGTNLLEPVVDIGLWRVTLLDSSVPGAVAGYLSDQQLALLERSLSEAPDRHHLICLHHHPVAIGCGWMETIGLRNPEALFALLGRFEQVRALLWGHVHQPFDQQRGPIRLLASPSTCVQFEPASEDFQVGSSAPGYRWLRLYNDGRLDTGVSRVEGFSFEVDYTTNGY